MVLKYQHALKWNPGLVKKKFWLLMTPSYLGKNEIKHYVGIPPPLLAGCQSPLIAGKHQQVRVSTLLERENIKIFLALVLFTTLVFEGKPEHEVCSIKKGGPYNGAPL